MEEKYFDSVTLEEYIRGLLYSRGNNTLGDVWEKCVKCDTCLFADKCHKLGSAMEDQGKNPTCGQVINILLGDLKPEEVKTVN